MKRNILRSLVAVVLLAAIYFLIIRSPEDKQGDLAPHFTSELITGEAFDLDELKGNYVLLDFWGSWCGPCRRDNPNLVRLYDEFSNKKNDQNQGFYIVTVALEKNEKTWQRAAEKDGFKWKHQIVEIAKAVLLSPIAQKYAVKDIPAKFLIDPDGKVIAVNSKYEEIRAILQENL